MLNPSLFAMLPSPKWEILTGRCNSSLGPRYLGHAGQNARQGLHVQTRLAHYAGAHSVPLICLFPIPLDKTQHHLLPFCPSRPPSPFRSRKLKTRYDLSLFTFSPPLKRALAKTGLLYEPTRARSTYYWLYLIPCFFIFFTSAYGVTVVQN